MRTSPTAGSPPGVVQYTWSSLNVAAYVAEVMAELASLRTVIFRANEVLHTRIEGSCRAITADRGPAGAYPALLWHQAGDRGFVYGGDLGIDTLLRVARLGRILRVLKIKQGIRTLVRTPVLSVPSLANVGGLLFLLYFLFSLLHVGI